ncbi:MAG: DUF72 domain-containing protein [Spirochaetae bacterium HGW-Spirochaetae-7]|jgi:uncharacterized protein YecE (DUF72 family)|nr:MAG: DUF72 domain-containing protein [Spirochaetae bacterium HGW-Spirochaetae-7]
MENLYIGTCSWKYPSWEGLVYSSREPDNYLAEYARRYRSVEVDQWFWSLGRSGAALPRKETVAEYDSSTPGDFRFTVKCPDALTLTHHRGRKGETLESNTRFLDEGFFMHFLESLATLVPKVGLFIFQFEYLNKEKMASRAVFVDRLGQFLERLPADIPYAVEIRNPRWMDAAWFDMLRDHGTAPVLLQGYWMDDIARTMDVNLDRLGDTLCIRLHGEDREGMEERTGADWSRIVRPKDEELQRISQSLKRTFGKGKTVYVNINNHYEGSAPRTIERITLLLQ